MFSKGPRFDPQKISDVPGLDKAERFVVTAPRSLGDRYAMLQQKVDDLERVHNDGKKAHRAEVERLKSELARCQKLVSEQTDRGKKQIDLLESRIQDLKKTNASDQTEIRELRVKLRTSEQERNKLTTKQGEAGEAKKSLQSLEIKRREELREKDRRIAELEKALNTEKTRKEAVEVKLQEINGQKSQAAQKLQGAEAEAKRAQDALASLREASSNQEEDLLAQLEHYRHLVGQVAEEYGRLARGTVSLPSYTRLRQENAAMAIQVSRLERKLANSVAQVDELAVLIRQTNDQKIFLSEQLEQADGEIASYKAVMLNSTLPAPDESISDILSSVERERAASLQDVYMIDRRTAGLFTEFYRVSSEQVLLEYAVLKGQLKCEQQLSEQHASSLASTLASHEAIAARLERAEEQKNAVNEELKAATDLTESLKSSLNTLTRQATEAERKLAEAEAHKEAAVKKERDVVRRLTETVQKMRTAEDALRAEVEQLTTELTDAERYQEAYHALSDEIGSLVAKNQLAEEEAQRLSKFNAEILGHHNPAQRIMYVDRIRRELAETKHKLVMLGREQEATAAINDGLQHELEMYKSVVVPGGDRPRTALTRVARVPLVSLARSLNASASANAVSASSGKGDAQRGRVLESIQGDMTIEEIM